MDTVALGNAFPLLSCTVIVNAVLPSPAGFGVIFERENASPFSPVFFIGSAAGLLDPRPGSTSGSFAQPTPPSVVGAPDDGLDEHAGTAVRPAAPSAADTSIRIRVM